MSGISSLDRSGPATFELALARLRAAEVEVATADPTDRGGSGDVVVSSLLHGEPWDIPTVSAVCARMAEGAGSGRLLFLEPTASSGWRALIQRSSGFGLLLDRGLGRRLGGGHHFDRDVPEEIRAAGFMINTLDRFSLGPLGIGTYVYGEATPDRRTSGLSPENRSRL